MIKNMLIETKCENKNKRCPNCGKSECLIQRIGIGEFRHCGFEFCPINPWKGQLWLIPKENRVQPKLREVAN